MLHAKTARLETPDDLMRWQRFVVNQIETSHPEMAPFVWFDRSAPGAAIVAARVRRGAEEAAICNTALPPVPKDPGTVASEGDKSEYFSREKIYRNLRLDQVSALARFRACKGFILSTIGSMMLSKLESVDAFNNAINEHNLVQIWMTIISTASPGGSAGNYSQAQRLIEFYALKQGDSEPISEFVSRYNDSKEKCSGKLNLDAQVEAMVMANMLNVRYINLQNHVRNRAEPVVDVESFKQILLSWTDKDPSVEVAAAASTANSSTANNSTRPRQKQRGMTKFGTDRPNAPTGCFACGQTGHAVRYCPLLKATRDHQQQLLNASAGASAASSATSAASGKKIESISLSYDT
jgi:hypothetical protein